MNGILIKYTELFRLSVQQLFYYNKFYKQDKIKPEPDISITPSASCISIMNRMNLVFKNTDTNAGFIMLASIKGTNGAGNDVLRFPAAKGDVLVFLMMLKNPDVINFNNLPAQPAADHIYYFSNEVNEAAAPRNNLHLTKTAAGVNGNADTVKKSNENYSFHSSTVIMPGVAKVKHLSSGITANPVSLITTAGGSDVIFNLSALPMGKCRLLISNIVTDEFYYLKEYALQAVFGIIELSLSSVLAANYRIIEAGNFLNAAKPFYAITFNNRKTFWRYTIRLQQTSPLYLEIAALLPADKNDFMNKLNIVTNDAAVVFSRISATDTEFVFVSNSKIFLQEKYFSSGISAAALNLTLKKYIGDIARAAVVKAYLPYPPTTLIDAATPPQIYSDIFLTL